MRILHVFRSPIGGLFRHVCDLSDEQQALGHEVGLVCDHDKGNAGANVQLEQLGRRLKLGVTRLSIARLPHPSDFNAVAAVSQLRKRKLIDILHGHGAKGGLIARLAGKPAIYTPHGGSLHYEWRSPAGAAFLLAEKALARRTAGFSFVCDFERDAFEVKIGTAGMPVAVVHNGLRPDEFAPIALSDGASDLLFVGEMRRLKGVDVLIDALARLTSLPLTATLVGDGPDLELFKQQVDKLGLHARINFAGRLPMAEAMTRGRMLVLPSRNESFPYVVLEALAAGRQVIASNVGGISEILEQKYLVAPNDPQALAEKLLRFHGETEIMPLNPRLTVRAMTQSNLAFYDRILRNY